MIEIAIHQADVLTFDCDALVMKYADRLRGADRAVAERIGFDGSVAKGHQVVVSAPAIPAGLVIFIGVGSLVDFRYAEIRAFGAAALSACARGFAETIAMTIHGPGYGLDERESFLSLVAGLDDAVRAGDYPLSLKRLAIVEREPEQAARLRELLFHIYPNGAIGSAPKTRSNDSASQPAVLWPKMWGETRLQKPFWTANPNPRLTEFGEASEAKPRLFVAMPFADQYSDIWDIAIREACAANDLVCERLDKEAFVGDIGAEMRRRIDASWGVIAVLDGANANVMLELGLAWGLGKPTILLAHADEAPPFDVRSQRCLKYTKLHGLRQTLTVELGTLKGNGTFVRP